MRHCLSPAAESSYNWPWNRASESTTGAIHVARAFDTHLLKPNRAARGLAEDTADAAWASAGDLGPGSRNVGSRNRLAFPSPLLPDRSAAAARLHRSGSARRAR